MKQQGKSFQKAMALILSVVMMVLAFRGGTLRAEWKTPMSRIRSEQSQLSESLEQEIKKVLSYEIPSLVEDENVVAATASEENASDSEDSEDSEPEVEPRIDPSSLEALLWILNRQTEQQKQRYEPHLRELTTTKNAETVFQSELVADYDAMKLWSDISTQDNALYLSAFTDEEDPERYLQDVHEKLAEHMKSRKRAATELDPAIKTLLPELEQTILESEALTLRDAVAVSQMKEKPTVPVNVANLDILLEQLLPKIFLENKEFIEAQDIGGILGRLSRLRMLDLMSRGYNGVLMESRYIDINDELLNLVRAKLSAWDPQTEANKMKTNLRQGLLLLESYTLLGTWIHHSSKSPTDSPISDDELMETWGATYEFAQKGLAQMTEHNILTQKQAAFRSSQNRPLPVTGFHAEVRSDGVYLSWDVPEDAEAPDYFAIYEVVGEEEQRLASTYTRIIRLDKPASGSHDYIVYSVNVKGAEEIHSEAPYQRGALQIQIPEPTTTPTATTVATTTLVPTTLTETSAPEPTSTPTIAPTTRNTTADPTTLTETSMPEPTTAPTTTPTTTSTPTTAPTTTPRQTTTPAPTTLPPTSPEPTTLTEPTTTPAPTTTESTTTEATTTLEETTKPTTAETTIPAETTPAELPPLGIKPLPDPIEPEEDLNYASEDDVDLEPVATFGKPSPEQQAIIDSLPAWVEGEVLFVDIQDFDGDGLGEAFVLVEEQEQSYQILFVPHEGDVQQVPGSELLKGLDPQNRYHHLKIDDSTMIYWISDVEDQNLALLIGLREGEVHHFLPSAQGDYLELFDPSEPTTLPAAPEIVDPTEDFSPLGAQKFVLFTSQDQTDGTTVYDRDYFVFDLEAEEFVRILQPEVGADAEEEPAESDSAATSETSSIEESSQSDETE